MVKNHHLAKSISDAEWGQFIMIVVNKAEEAPSNGDQSESIVYVSGLLTLRPSNPDHASDTYLSLFELQSGHTSGPQRRETNRTKGAGSPFGEQARSRLRRTENLPGGRPGIPRHNAVAFGGGRMSSLYTQDNLSNYHQNNFGPFRAEIGIAQISIFRAGNGFTNRRFLLTPTI
jgi:hypothetical protein